jgi:hypothetical protein
MSAPLLDSLHVPRRFHAGPHETRENGRGDGGARPHEWVFPGAPRIPPVGGRRSHAAASL